MAVELVRFSSCLHLDWRCHCFDCRFFSTDVSKCGDGIWKFGCENGKRGSYDGCVELACILDDLLSTRLAGTSCRAGLIAFARGLGEFGATLMLAGYIPGKTDTIPMAIYFAVESGQMEKATFWVVIIVALGFSTIMWLNWWSKRNIERYKNDNA